MTSVIYMPHVPFTSPHVAPLELAHFPANDSLWNFLPPDTLALVASHLKPRYIAAARETCKAWRHGISRGVTTLAPNVQSPSGGRIGSVASYYLYAALRWQDMPMLLAVFDSCRVLDLRNATVSLGCVHLLRGAPSLECLRLRSDFFSVEEGASKYEELQQFIMVLPTSIQRVELDLRWDAKEFPAALDRSSHLKPLPAGVEVDTLHINSAHFQLRHMDSVTAFGALKVLRIERLAFVGAHMDDAAFALIGRLTHLEELALNVVLGGITDQGFLAGLESLHCLRYLELFSVRQMSDAALEVLCSNWGHLGSLRLASCERLTDRALLAMSGLPALYHLFLSGNQSFSHGLMSALKQRIKLATFRQCGDLSVCIYGSLPPAAG